MTSIAAEIERPALSEVPASASLRVPVLVGLILFILALAPWTRIMNDPFLGNDEGNGTFWLVVSRNFVRYGPLASRLAGVMNGGVVPQDQWQIYAHHPFLPALMISAVEAAFGFSDFTARLVPVFFTLAIVLLVYIMIGRRFGWGLGFLAGIFYAWAPMTLLFGGMPEVTGPPLFFFCLATTACYLRWIETRRRGWFLGVAACFALGALCDWQIFYVAAVLGLHHLLAGRPALGRRIFHVALAGLACFVVLVLLIAWTWWAGQGSSIIDQIHHRTITMRSDSGSAITLRTWFDWVVMGINFRLHTPLMLVLTVGYMLAMLLLALRRRWDRLDRHLGPILVLGWGFAYLFTGIQHTFQHRWCDAFLTSGFAMASAAALWALARCGPAALGRPGARVGVIAALAMAYGLWTLPFARAERQREYRGIDDGYSLRALGMMIRSCSDERDGVLTSDCFVRPGRPCNSHPTLWYYADRQMRVGVRTPADLDAALPAGPYPAMFLYWSGKSIGPAPKWFVLPRAHRKQLPKLTAALDARFRRRPMALYGEWFDVYALQEPVKTAQ